MLCLLRYQELCLLTSVFTGTQVRTQLERRMDWCDLEPRLAKLVQRVEAGLKLLWQPEEGPRNPLCCSGAV